MTPVIRTAHAWMLTLLLLTGFLSPRVCQACPVETVPPAGQTQTCCDHDDPADHPADETPDKTPGETPDEAQHPTDHPPTSENGCDCPFGCCTLGIAKALTPPAPATADADESARWDLTGFRSRPVPGRDGPRRPPRI